MIGVSLSLIIGSTGALDRASAQSGPTVWFGASTLVHHFDTEAEEFANIEAQLGQRFAITRTFKQWDDPFPNPTESWLLSTNHRLIVSLKAEYENGAKVLWDDIANSTPGTPIYDNVVRIATGIRDTGQPTYFVFHHEPEVKGHEVFGEAPQFIAAWRKIVTIFRAVGANQVKFLFTMTDHAFRVPVTDIRSVENWYPGDNWVDAVGADTYNWYDCRVAGGDWTSLEVLLKGQRWRQAFA